MVICKVDVWDLRFVEDTSSCQQKRRYSNVGNNAGSRVTSQRQYPSYNPKRKEGDEIKPPQVSRWAMLDENIKCRDAESRIDGKFGHRNVAHDAVDVEE